MEIEDLTLKQIRQLQTMLGVSDPGDAHPMIGKHCVIRTYSDGVHLGTPVKINGMEVLLKNSRRLWRWEGAFTLSEIAINGVNSTSRIAVELPEYYVTQAISFIPTTEVARKTFEACHEK